jgi:hypothetical protein
VFEYEAPDQDRTEPKNTNLRPPDAGDTAGVPVTDLPVARIRRRKVVGGLIHEYGRMKKYQLI